MKEMEDKHERTMPWLSVGVSSLLPLVLLGIPEDFQRQVGR